MIRLILAIFPFLILFVACNPASQPIDSNNSNILSLDAYQDFLLMDYLQVKDSFKISDTLALVLVYDLEVIKNAHALGDSLTHHMLHINSYPTLEDPFFYFEHRKYMPQINFSTSLSYLKVDAITGEIFILYGVEGEFVSIDDWKLANGKMN